MARDPSTQLAELARQNFALEEQLKLLIKTESRLYRTQRQLDEQLRRINVLNRFALSASRLADPAEILGETAESLMAMFPFEQVLGLFCEGQDASRPKVVCAVPGREAQAAARPRRLAIRHDELEAIDRAILYTDAPLAPRPEVLERPLALCEEVFGPSPVPSPHLVLPLFRQGRVPLALLIARRITPSVTYHAPLPSEADLAFLQLFAHHAENAIENTRLVSDLARFAADLEERVRARTAELRQAQDQLVSAGKMAAIGTLVAGLSHELNNPIGMILGAAQVLLETTDAASPARRPLGVIERQARRCARLVGALLDFSRKREPIREPVGAGELLERVERLVSGHPRRHQARFQLAADPGLPKLSICATEVESALLNLISNAFDASPAGGLVEVRAERAERDGLQGVQFRVNDAGSGIPPEVLPRIFDPFFTTKAVGQGTGLGLSLTRRIALAHDGRIEVDTRPGGTSFYLWLPALVADRPTMGGP